MSFPKIDVNILNGNLGIVAGIGIVPGLIGSGVATAQMALGASKLIYNLAGLSALGITGLPQGLTAATATVTITGTGNGAGFILNFPGTPAINLCSVTPANGLSLSDVAVSIAAVINTNTGTNGFSAVAAGTIVTISAPLSKGSSINGTALLTGFSGAASATLTPFAGGVTGVLNPGVYRQVSEYYSEGREGLPLWLMMVNPTLSMTGIADKTNAYAKKLIDDSGGTINLLGITRTPSSNYVPSVSGGLDDDFYAALLKAHELRLFYATKNQPLRVLLEARSFNGDETTLTNLHTYACNGVCGVLISSQADGSSSVGLALGRKAGSPVQRKISRVKDGPLPIATCYVGATPVAGYAGVETIHDKGFITARTFPNKAGYYFSDDPTATALTDDYSSLTNGMVIDKAHRIAADVYTNELNDEILVQEDGTLNPGTVRSLEAKIDNAINLQMAGEISGFTSFISLSQNIISTGKLIIQARCTPVGYFKNIVIELGMYNPALN